MPFLRELGHHLAHVSATLRKKRAFADLLQVEVAQDIARDLASELHQVRDQAYAAQQEDVEAERLMATVLADKKVTAAEIPLLETALRHVKRSGQRDHQITEACDV